jgi:hypothetical protein
VSLGVQLAEGQQGAFGTAVVPVQRADDRARRAGRVQRLPQDEPEHGVGAHLDEAPVAVGQQPLRRLVEPHAAAQVLEPVGAVELAALDPVARDRGVDRQRARPRGDTTHARGELVPDLLDRRAVRGVVDADPACEDGVTGELRDQLVDRARLAGDQAGVRPVDTGHPEPLTEARQPVLQREDRLLDRGHRALPGQAGERAAAQGDQPGGVVPRQRARDARGGDLALAVAHDRVRLDAERAPERRERDHDGEEGGLHHVDAVPRGVVGVAAQERQWRPVHVR